MEKFKLADSGFYLGDDFESSDRLVKWVIDEDNKVLDIVSTQVDEKYAGQGLGRELVFAAAEYAREHNLKVRGTCPFAKVMIERNEKYSDLLVD